MGLLSGWTDDSVAAKQGGNKGAKINFLIMKGQQVCRINLIDPNIMAVNLHYYGRKYFRCFRDKQEDCPICHRVQAQIDKDPKNKNLYRGLPKLKLGTNILVYNQDLKGNLLEPFGVQIMMWKFDRDKYGAIKNIIKEWGDPTGYDIEVGCTEERFQKFTFTPTKVAAYKKTPEIETYVKTIYTQNRYNIEKIMGFYLEKDKLIEAMDEIDKMGPAPDPNKGPTNTIQPGAQNLTPPVVPADQTTQTTQQKTPDRPPVAPLTPESPKSEEKKPPEEKDPAKFKQLLNDL